LDGAGVDAVLPNPLKPESLDIGLSWFPRFRIESMRAGLFGAAAEDDDGVDVPVATLSLSLPSSLAANSTLFELPALLELSAL
jgi:hypothetical protein